MQRLPLTVLQLVPEYHQRVWGGQRLKAADPPIGEAWIVYERNRVASGPHAGATLAELAETYGAELLGRRAVAQTGVRFPLLIKLLDCADWLSIQVHPDDAHAREMEGPGHFGKTEGWYVVEAEPGAQVIAGVRPGATREALAQAVREGNILDWAQYVPVRAGDTIFTPAGTIHALGPGMLLYEVQQTSDITYRLFDWNRPQSAGRQLHVEQALAVIDPGAVGRAAPSPALGDGDARVVMDSRYFTLAVLAGTSRPVCLDTAGESFHAITVVEGALRLEGDGWTQTLGRFETALVPAACGAYTVQPEGAFRALKGSVE